MRIHRSIILNMVSGIWEERRRSSTGALEYSHASLRYYTYDISAIGLSAIETYCWQICERHIVDSLSRTTLFLPSDHNTHLWRTGRCGLRPGIGSHNDCKHKRLSRPILQHIHHWTTPPSSIFVSRRYNGITSLFGTFCHLSLPLIKQL